MKFDTDRGPRYLEWSSVVDAPVSWGVTLKKFKEYYKEEYGRSGLEELDQRLERVEMKGTSSRVHSSVDEQIRYNRAGRGETRLTKEQIIEYFCADYPVGTKPGEIPVGVKDDDDDDLVGQ